MALGGVGDYVLFYNKKDFAKAGISSPPATWTQLESDAIKLSDPAKHHYGIYIPFGTDEWISYDWESLLWAAGYAFAMFDFPAKRVLFFLVLSGLMIPFTVVLVPVVVALVAQRGVVDGLTLGAIW
jgi:hypothetical protein